MMTPTEYTLRLLQVRRAAHMRRASACALVPERVLGVPLRPITPASWSLLVGTESAFVTGSPADEADVRNFVLFHLPEFDADRPRAGAYVRFLSRWRLERVLCPFRTPGMRRVEVRAGNLARAIADCRAIVDEAFADTPMPDARNDGQPPRISAALEPQFLQLFASSLQWWPLETPVRHTPIRVLSQMARCIDRAPYFDAAEAALDAELLRDINPQQKA